MRDLFIVQTDTKVPGTHLVGGWGGRGGVKLMACGHKKMWNYMVQYLFYCGMEWDIIGRVLYVYHMNY